MATEKQIAANRRNAQKSTGPKSPEGKAKVSQNRTVYGLCGNFRVMDEIEEQENYDTLLSRFVDELNPSDQRQHELVVKMAKHTWLSNRALRMQGNCFVLEEKTPEQKKDGDTPVRIEEHSLQLSMRYHTTHDRAYQRAAAEFDKLKKEERLAEIGFESQKRAQAEEARKAEKHKVTMAIANTRRQREEMKLGDEFAKMLPPDITPQELNAVFGNAAQTR